MLTATKNILKKLAGKILNLDDTVRPQAHLKFFEDYLDRFNFDTNTRDSEKFLSVLKKKHLVDDIVVATMNGGSVVSSNGNAISESVTGAALFNYVQSEHPRSETILIKSNGWYMIFPRNQKLFIVKASSDLSNVELGALAKEIESFLSLRELQPNS